MCKRLLTRDDVDRFCGDVPDLPGGLFEMLPHETRCSMMPPDIRCLCFLDLVVNIRTARDGNFLKRIESVFLGEMILTNRSTAGDCD